ncbi:MAG: ferrochelatase [Ilumatobacteraceae bacterium]
MGRTGVIVAQLGGPAHLDQVEPFIKSIFADPDLVPLPGGRRTRSVFSALVARLRAPRVRARYDAIGGGSPIIETTRQQADALADELGARGHDVIVAVAHRHSFPDTEAAVDAVLAAGGDRLLLLPLFPQYSRATTGSSESELRRVVAARGSDVPLRVVRSWCDHPSYLDLQARLVDEMLDTVPVEQSDGGLVVYSAHGLPERTVERGDPYVEEVEATVADVTGRLQRPVEHQIAFQSRTGPIKWVGPDVREVIQAAATDGRPWVGVVPISFVSEHLETLHELDIELAGLAHEVGLGDFVRSRCPDVRPEVGPVLADIVEEYL